MRQPTHEAGIVNSNILHAIFVLDNPQDIHI